MEIEFEFKPGETAYVLLKDDTTPTPCLECGIEGEINGEMCRTCCGHGYVNIPENKVVSVKIERIDVDHNMVKTYTINFKDRGYADAVQCQLFRTRAKANSEKIKVPYEDIKSIFVHTCKFDLTNGPVSAYIIDDEDVIVDVTIDELRRVIISEDETHEIYGIRYENQNTTRDGNWLFKTRAEAEQQFSNDGGKFKL